MMGPYYAILEGKTVVPVDDVLTMGRFLEDIERRTIGRDEIVGILISTVFLGINHGFGRTPLWFETMIFGGEHHDYQERYSVWEEAELGHAKAVALVLNETH